MRLSIKQLLFRLAVELPVLLAQYIFTTSKRLSKGNDLKAPLPKPLQCKKRAVRNHYHCHHIQHITFHHVADVFYHTHWEYTSLS